ncbi:hypothetical protein CEXT_282211 [Caerostris extrusa]|uniref:Uncharacterized protein n=1 Tax=Caerostris extrusa TaxID=172846 RepID=A0AAV4XHU6_CAEEX|nr:hypothetical protein CEXT_282211 [Caerostris extrusa]
MVTLFHSRGFMVEACLLFLARSYALTSFPEVLFMDMATEETGILDHVSLDSFSPLLFSFYSTFAFLLVMEGVIILYLPRKKKDFFPARCGVEFSTQFRGSRVVDRIFSPQKRGQR